LSTDIAPSDDVIFEVDDMLLLESDVSVSGDSGVSYIMAAMLPLAENVEPSAALEVSLAPVVFVVVPAVEVSLLVLVGFEA
jgi:hypothetical protein